MPLSVIRGPQFLEGETGCIWLALSILLGREDRSTLELFVEALCRLPPFQAKLPDDKHAFRLSMPHRHASW